MPAAVRVMVFVVLTALLAAGCSGDDPAPVGSKGTVTVGSGARPEAQIIARMYALALQEAGFEVTDRFDAGTRAAYVPALQRGELDVVPEYLSALTGYLDTAKNGAAGQPPTGDVERTLRTLQGLLAGRPLRVSPLSTATDQTAYAVTKKLADRERLGTVSDLVRLNGQLVLGGPAGCSTDHFCLGGLQDVYGLRFKDVLAVGEVSSRPVFDALQEGAVDVGAVLSSAGGVAANNLVVLEDDRRLQQPGNILALYRDVLPQEARDVVGKVNQALTTEKLQELNKKVEMDGEDAAELAKRFLQDARII